MAITRLHRLQAGLTLVILVLLLVILYPAWTVASARFNIASERESGATLAERYLILGDWPSGNESNLLHHFDHFQINPDSAQEFSEGESEGLAPMTQKQELQ